MNFTSQDSTAQPAPAGGVVLDTHVALEWLWFADARTRALGHCISQGRRPWWACSRMTAEWQRVLRRLAHAAVQPAQSQASISSEEMPCENSKLAHTQYLQHTRVWTPLPPPAPFRCSDPDDQMFIDLALAAGASCLLTRDRALLKLRSRARERGLLIGAPEDWSW
jgi:predicted nucleic acid-binding protein